MPSRSRKKIISLKIIPALVPHFSSESFFLKKDCWIVASERKRVNGDTTFWDMMGVESFSKNIVALLIKMTH